MHTEWTDAIGRLDAAIADRLARTPVPTPNPAPPPAPDVRALFARWEAALDKLASDTDLDEVIVELEAFRERIRRASGTARAA